MASTFSPHWVITSYRSPDCFDLDQPHLPVLQVEINIHQALHIKYVQTLKSGITGFNKSEAIFFSSLYCSYFIVIQNCLAQLLLNIVILQKP